jgi:hypothetical protein
MIDKERENILSAFKGMSLEQRTYMLSLFSYTEILAELNERLASYEVALHKIQETISAT